MQVDVVCLPAALRQRAMGERSVVGLDVLRATTTMVAALAAGAREIRLFQDIEAARRAAGEVLGGQRPLLCGEERCLRPAGFDLGNSPGDLSRQGQADRILLMATTNGTRALYAARGAAVLLVGAIVNAGAVAAALVEEGRDATLLCAGTAGDLSLEDLIGAGAIIDALERKTRLELAGDAARLASRLFGAAKGDLHAALADAQGGRNVLAAGLGDDIRFASRLDALPVVGRALADGEELRVVSL